MNGRLGILNGVLLYGGIVIISISAFVGVWTIGRWIWSLT